MLRKIAATAAATTFVLLAIALAPHVPTALATASQRADAADELGTAASSCESFEVWFLDSSCAQSQRAKRIARVKQQLAHKANR
jgi:hypothetical protein